LVIIQSSSGIQSQFIIHIYLNDGIILSERARFVNRRN
jgi:hypothetical protein